MREWEIESRSRKIPEPEPIRKSHLPFAQETPKKRLAEKIAAGEISVGEILYLKSHLSQWIGMNRNFVETEFQENKFFYYFQTTSGDFVFIIKPAYYSNQKVLAVFQEEVKKNKLEIKNHEGFKIIFVADSLKDSFRTAIMERLRAL